MKFELSNDLGEVVLAAESNCTWEDGGQAVYTVGDMNMLSWCLTPESKPRWHLIFTTGSGDILYSLFTRSARHYGLKYTGDPSLGKTDIVLTAEQDYPNLKPLRPVYTGNIYEPEVGRSAHLRPVKRREYILQTPEGKTVLRARMEPGRWHEQVSVSYEGDSSVVRWSGSPAEPRWVFSFFLDAGKFEGLNFVGPDSEGENYMRTLPPGWDFVEGG